MNLVLLFIQEIIQTFANFFNDFFYKFLRLDDSRDFSKLINELFLIFMVSVPFSLFMYFFFIRKHRNKMLVDLGQHKWILKK